MLDTPSLFIVTFPSINVVCNEIFTTFASMDARYVYDSVELAYTVEGEGDVVMLLHGWGCDASVWRTTVELLRNNFRVVAVDFAGFGRSAEPREVWGVEEYTRSIEALVAELGIVCPTLIGHSFGGRVATLYASRNDVKAVVLADAAGIKPRRTFAYYHKVYTYKLMKHLLPLLIGGHKAQMLLDQRRARAASADYNRATPKMRAILSKCVNEDLCHVMPRVTAPVLLFWGDKDTATPIADAHKMQRLMPNAGLVVAEGRGHFAMLEAAELWQGALMSFLNIK